jgi:mannose-1-phosphate guanylyltransferase
LTDIKIVILAGGQGTRFWPISRGRFPKQFLSISSGEESLIQATVSRVRPLADEQDILVTTNAQHVSIIKEHLPLVEVISEPVGRNTAPAVGLAALHVVRANPDAVMILLPADHIVSKEQDFLDTLNRAAQLAGELDVLVTVGLKPLSPHTGFGYIQRGDQVGDCSYRVSRFSEKPDLERARKYLESGDYYWNSGMFIWKAKVLLQAIEKHMPALYEGLMRIDSAIGTDTEASVVQNVFDSLESVSIDYGVMEHAENCAVVIAGDIGWSDVGSWDAWSDHCVKDQQGNAVLGDVLALESRNCVVNSREKLTALIGLEDVVIIDSRDALLVCKRDRVQDVKEIVAELKQQGREDLL